MRESCEEMRTQSYRAAERELAAWHRAQAEATQFKVEADELQRLADGQEPARSLTALRDIQDTESRLREDVEEWETRISVAL